MYLAPQNNTVALYGEGLNGFWSRIGRFAKRLAAKALRAARKLIAVATDGVSEASGFGDQLNNWANDLEASANASGSRDVSETQLSASEIAILTNFAEQKLGPFLRKVIDNFLKELNSGNLQRQLIAANKLFKLKAALLEYYSKNQLSGLSANAIAQRLEIIEAIFLPAEDVIENTFTDDFSRMIVSDQVLTPELSDYPNLIDQSFVGKPFQTEKLQPNVPLTQIPPQTVATGPKPNTTVPTTPVVTPGTNPTTPAPVSASPSPAPPKTNNTKKMVFAVALGIGGILLFSSSNRATRTVRKSKTSKK